MKYIFLFFLLVAVITTGCTQSGPVASKVTTAPTVISCDDWINPTKCGGICYNSYENDCCGGTIYPHDTVYPYGSTGSCCGEKWYPKNEKEALSTCCGGKMYPTQSGWECCPDPSLFFLFPVWQNYTQVWIDTSTQHCCGGKVTSGGKYTGDASSGAMYVNYRWEVCGNSSCYDTRTQSCCRSSKQENNETIAVYIVKEGRRSCCLNLTFQIPENNRCNPEDGSITRNNTGMGDNCKGFADGSVRCLGPGQRWS